MNTDVLSQGQNNLRATDGNSLLRMYDTATEILAKSTLQQERAKADKVIRRITKELQRRNIAP
ncbi:MAG: hypothetical protein K2R98_32015 [Gemmataceae bacterium]|nr:hypothetical protein [Gemmataceae bacterium]